MTTLIVVTIVDDHGNIRSHMRYRDNDNTEDNALIKWATAGSIEPRQKLYTTDRVYKGKHSGETVYVKWIRDENA